MPVALVDGETRKIEEDLQLVLGEFDPQFLVTVEMRGAVIVVLDADITVGVQRRLRPVAAGAYDSMLQQSRSEHRQPTE